MIYLITPLLHVFDLLMNNPNPKLVDLLMNNPKLVEVPASPSSDVAEGVEVELPNISSAERRLGANEAVFKPGLISRSARRGSLEPAGAKPPPPPSPPMLACPQCAVCRAQMQGWSAQVR